MALILASGSPRRRELLQLITQDFTVLTSEVDEGTLFADTPARLAQTLATAKAQAVAASHPEDLVLGCDTVVDCGGVVFGKPADEADALRMLRALSGRAHKVHTGVCVCRHGRSAATVEEKMEEIRLVNRAKWLLIECLSMSEAEAHRYIEKQAMDRCVTRREIARGIIQTYA